MKQFTFWMWVVLNYGIGYIFIKDIQYLPFAIGLGWVGGIVGILILQSKD